MRFTFDPDECIVIYIGCSNLSANQVCNFTEMLTHPAFEPHFPGSCWEHQATVRPEAPFLSRTDAGSTLSFVDVNRLARRLKRFGVAKWDGVVMLLARFALANFGAVEVEPPEIGPKSAAIEAQRRRGPGFGTCFSRVEELARDQQQA
jgi:hypothetical protein